MKIVINSTVWKKAVATALSLVGKNSGNPNESCVGIIAEEGVVKLFTLEAGIHSTIIKLNSDEYTLEGENEVYIQHSSLDRLNKTLESGTLSITIKDNQLLYSLDNLGSINEPLFHNQDPFKGMILMEEEYIKLDSPNSLLNVLINKIKPITDYKDSITKKSKIGVFLDGEDSVVFGQVASSGFITYKFTSPNYSNFALNADLLKKVSFILERPKGISEEEYIVTVYKSNKHIKFVSPNGVTIITLDKINDLIIQQLNTLDSKEVEASVLIKTEELSKVIKWQTYNRENGDIISILSKEDRLLIQGSKVYTPSELEYGELTPFDKINLPVESLIAAINVFNRDDELVTLAKVDSSGANYNLKVALFKLDKEDISTTIYLYEVPRL